MIRLLAVLAGSGLLGATAHVTVVATGGYSSEHAPIVIAVAIGVAVASACIGKAIAERRYGLAMLMFVCTLAGEAYSLVATAERIVAARDSLQAPLVATAAGRRAVDKIECRVTPFVAGCLPYTAPRSRTEAQFSLNFASPVVLQTARSCRRILRAPNWRSPKSYG